jgi:hypothetical protein
MKIFIRIFPIVIMFFMTACGLNGGKTGSQIQFDPMANFSGGDTILLDMDMKDVVNQGVVIPSARQCDGGKFVFEFKGEKGKYYKIFYQNESYKFSEKDELSYENFYGSWEDVDVEFKKIEKTGKVRDSVRIVGNPRDERKYYGSNYDGNPFSAERVNQLVRHIDRDTLWSRLVREQAVTNNVTYERNLRLNALYMIKEQMHKGNDNQRWKRNPRVGCYSFMLVICDENALSLIPDCVKNIGKTGSDGNFINPYSYFANNSIEGVEVYHGDRILKTRAVITPEYGLYFDDMVSGSDDKLYAEALFEQFFNHPSDQFTLRNIPVIQDVVSDENPYTRAQYEANKTRFDSTELLYDHPVISSEPGKTVKIDELDGSLVLINPGNNDINNLRKESTGIKTRVGFTYGKFRGKIKFPVMLNEEHIWNGLTYAFWMLHQDSRPWNNRRPSKTGYVRKESVDPNPERVNDYYYSEIDIEIAKASKYWPKKYYFKQADSHVEDASLNDDVIFGCTNWDMACLDVPKYKSGVFRMNYGKKGEYEAMRWTPVTQAMTIRTPISNEVFKNDYYYYEIEWSPKSITWRLGPSPDKMQVVGYMSDEYSSIPDNQMLCIITQEYHYSEWWAPVVFWQGLIPYNKTDIVGKVFEIVVE